MTTILPLLQAHQREHTYCAFCPKLCRHSCPVSTVQAKETTTPWGKMSSIHHVAEGNVPANESHASTWYACTGCLRCKEFCDHGNEVALALNAGRAEAVPRGIAPSKVYEIIEKFPERLFRVATVAEELFGEALGFHSDTMFVPGCSTCVRNPNSAKCGQSSVEALTGKQACVEASSCCGLPLFDAGDREGFLSYANQFFARVKEKVSPGGRVVFQDPGCLNALKVVAPTLGLEVPEGYVFEHISELAARMLDKLKVLDEKEINGGEEGVRYIDACKLGRGLGIYDAPREVLSAMFGKDPDEFFHSRNYAECSGGGGQLPRTDPKTADGIVELRVSEHKQYGGGLLVTACPTSAIQLKKQSKAEEFTVLLAKSLGVEPPSSEKV